MPQRNNKTREVNISGTPVFLGADAGLLMDAATDLGIGKAWAVCSVKGIKKSRVCGNHNDRLL